MPVFGLELPLLLLLLGLGLMIMEALSPGAHLIVLGVALVMAGIVGTFVGAASGPLALAGLTLLFGAVALYFYREYDIYGGGSAGQTSDSSSLRGNTGTVVDHVTATEGRVKLDDGGFNPYYQARALDDEIAVGEEVIVVDPGGGNVLQVMAQSAGEADDIDRALRRDAQRREADAHDGTETASEDGAASQEDEATTQRDLESERSRE